MAHNPGRVDIQAQVISMSTFRAALRQGYLEMLKGIYAYVIWTNDYTPRFMVMEPDYSYLPEQNFDWTHTIMFMRSYLKMFQIL